MRSSRGPVIASIIADTAAPRVGYVCRVRTLLLAAALALLGCKEKASPKATPPPGPAEAGPATPPPAPSPDVSDAAVVDDAGATSADAAVDVMASPKCCCAMPTAEPTFELQPRDYCQGDLKGTCVIARKCTKGKR